MHSTLGKSVQFVLGVVLAGVSSSCDSPPLPADFTPNGSWSMTYASNATFEVLGADFTAVDTVVLPKSEFPAIAPQDETGFEVYGPGVSVTHATRAISFGVFDGKTLKQKLDSNLEALFMGEISDGWVNADGCHVRPIMTRRLRFQDSDHATQVFSAMLGFEPAAGYPANACQTMLSHALSNTLPPDDNLTILAPFFQSPDLDSSALLSATGLVVNFNATMVKVSTENPLLLCAAPPVYDLPFRYELDRSRKGVATRVRIKTESSDLYGWFSPWSPRAEPHSGHIENDFKANWMALWVDDVRDLITLADPTQPCTSPTGSGCGVAATDAEIAARIPDYISRDPRTIVTSVQLDKIEDPATSIYWGSLNQWRVEAKLCDQFYSFGHVGWIGADLRQKMIEQGFRDPNTVTAADIGTNLITHDFIVMPEGSKIARPQMILRNGTYAPGLIAGNIQAQMEFPTAEAIDGPGGQRPHAPYAWLSSAKQIDFTNILVKNMQNPFFPTYATASPQWAWLWKAEGALWRGQPYADREEYSSIFDYQGEWLENNASRNCTNRLAVDCDERFVFVPIIKTSPIYTASLYGDAGDNVSTIVINSKSGFSALPWGEDAVLRGEVVTPSTLDAREGRFLIKWRMKDYGTEFTPPQYQAVAYRLDSSAKILRMTFGARRTVRSQASFDARGISFPTEATVCDGVVSKCFAHESVNQGTAAP